MNNASDDTLTVLSAKAKFGSRKRGQVSLLDAMESLVFLDGAPVGNVLNPLNLFGGDSLRRSHLRPPYPMHAASSTIPEDGSIITSPYHAISLGCVGLNNRGMNGRHGMSPHAEARGLMKRENTSHRENRLAKLPNKTLTS